MANNSRLKMRKGTRLIDAEFTFEVTGTRNFEIILESSGGSSGGRALRNSEYPEGLTELLRRITRIASSLDDCLVVSRPTRDMPESERRVYPTKPFEYPIALRLSGDFDKLRLALTSPQGAIASNATKGGGNERKRIALRFTAREQVISEDKVMLALDAAPSDTPRRDRKDIATGLSNEDIDVAREVWRQIGADAFHEKFGTKRSMKLIVADPDGTEYDATAILFAAQTIAGIDGATTALDGDDRTVAEPLIDLGYVLEDISVKDGGDWDPEDPSETQRTRAIQQARAFAGNTDSIAERRVRREQRLLRRALGLRNGSNTCSLCGRTYPDQLLVAAHIKKRSECTREERVDIPAIAMVACSLGCDALFESGYICVNADGVIEAKNRHDTEEHIRELTAKLHGRALAGYNSKSAQYFAWHRANT